MSDKALITADFATPGDVASRLRIPAWRTQELRRQMADMVVQGSAESKFVTEDKRGGVQRRRASKARTSSKKK